MIRILKWSVVSFLFLGTCHMVTTVARVTQTPAKAHQSPQGATVTQPSQDTPLELTQAHYQDGLEARVWCMSALEQRQGRAVKYSRRIEQLDPETMIWEVILHYSRPGQPQGSARCELKLEDSEWSFVTFEVFR